MSTKFYSTSDLKAKNNLLKQIDELIEERKLLCGTDIEFEFEVPSYDIIYMKYMDDLDLFLSMIKSYEKFVDHTYDAQPGKGDYTIGYGHKLYDDYDYYKNRTISEEEALDLLMGDVSKAAYTTFIPFLVKNKIAIIKTQMISC